jgi:group I intron endonuclease
MSYIGQTICTQNRFIQHQSKRSDCRFIHNIIKKYGWESLEITILQIGLTLEQANKLETLFIKMFHTLAPNGYNLNMGGDNRTPSEETKRMTSQSMKEHWKNGPSSKNNDREAKRLLMTSLWLNENFRQYMYQFTSDRMKEMWAKPDFRINHSNKMKDVWADRVFKYKMYYIFASDDYRNKLRLKQTIRFSTVEGLRTVQ